jgi:hypothetical protein
MSSDINVQTFSGKVNINNNLLVGSSHLFVDTVNNRVGITTADPQASLDVNGDVNVGTNLTLGGILTGDGSGLTNVNSDSGLWAGAGTGSVYLSTSTDNVGIGTTEPSSKLHVETPTGTSTNLVRIGSYLNSGSSQSVSGIEFAGNPAFYNGDNGQRVAAQITSGFYEGGTADWNDGYISLRTPNNPASGTLNDILTVRGGNVGIGDTNPGHKFVVKSGSLDEITTFKIETQGSITIARNHNSSPFISSNMSSGHPKWNLGNVTTTRTSINGGSNQHSYFNTGGNVGIGTTSPVTSLDLGDLGGGSIRLGRDHDGDNTSTNRIGRTGVGNTVWYSSINFEDEGANDDAISFVTHESGVGQFERMRISGNGNVGIGTTDPKTRLHVGVGNAILRVGAVNYAGSAANTSTYGLERSRNQILFSTWRDARTDKIGAKICGINKQTYSSPNARHLIQSTDLAFYTVPPGSGNYDDTVERLRITDAGKVGIGKTDPSYNLDVSGNLRVTNGILDTSWCSGSWLQTCTQSPTVTVYSNNGGGPMSTPGHGGSGMGGNRGRFTAKKEGNYLISCCAVHMGRGTTTSSGTNLLVVFDAVGTNWNLNNVINTYDEIIDLRTAPTAEEAYTFMCQVYMNVGHYFSFRVHSSAYIDNNAKLLCSAALVR